MYTNNITISQSQTEFKPLLRVHVKFTFLMFVSIFVVNKLNTSFVESLDNTDGQDKLNFSQGQGHMSFRLPFNIS